MRIKYFYQLIASHLSILLIAFLVLSLLFVQYVEDFAYEEKAEELESYGQKILEVLESPRPGSGLQSYVSMLEARNINFIVFDQQSRILYPSAGNFPPVVLTQEEWNVIEQGETLVVNRDVQRFEYTVTFVALPYVENGRLIGGVLLASPISGTSEMISELNKSLLTTILIALAVALLLSLLLSKLHVSRLQRMQKAVAMISEGNYAVNLPESHFDEFGDLAKDFNKMANKLQRSNEEIERLENRRRQFMADVSHEMRTPLTTIAGVIEGLRNNMIEEDQREKGIRLVSDETKRLMRLVNENLDYEKIRSNQVTLTKEEIEADELLEIIQEQLQMQAAEKGNVIEVQTEPDQVIYGDMDRLIQILTNIVKNSIQFTENGRILLKAFHEPRFMVIEVQDSGTGIDVEEIDMIWRRFYKSDLSRGSGQFGLGLSIVKQLVTLHDGDIRVESEKGKGTKFTIHLPHKAKSADEPEIV
ncbi:HAMP domain-containing sensor histidine kinase [Planococcus shenhongbingii]|uniref:sensor histidine kinase n=1 Tax=Planococcus shenhongbingii TaxID=3058398 RepID=UPI002624CD70|nr:HAMP domain-containing sensor histidine kinase [Planococcus sp. N016]WKA60517.1 HAMP domain-containing sensor histidine kinase [Planococcus sp. N016]